MSPCPWAELGAAAWCWGLAGEHNEVAWMWLCPSFAVDLSCCPVQTSASSMTPLLHPMVTRKTFQEPSWTHPMLFPFAVRTQTPQWLWEGMLQTQEQQICPRKALQEPDSVN